MGVVDGVLGFLSNMYALQNQQNANEQARRDQFFFYNDQKAYQDPRAVMDRNRLAGINPYGDFINGQIGQPTPVNTAQGIGEIAGNIGSNLSSAAQNFLQRMYYKLEVKRLQLETKRTDKEIESIDAKNELTKSQTIFQDLVNVLQRDTNPWKTQYSKAEAEEKIAQALIAGTQSRFEDERLDTLIKQMYSVIGLQDAQKKNVQYNTNTYLPKQLEMQQRASDDTHNLSVEDLARKQLDNSDIKAIDQILDTIGQSSNDGLKNFLKVILMVFKNMKK